MLQSNNQTTISQNNNQNASSLVMNVGESGMMNLVEEVELSISCNNLPNLDLLSLTDAQVHIFSSSTSSNQNNWVFVGKTEIIWDNLYPKVCNCD